MIKKNCSIGESAKDILNILSDMAVVVDGNGNLLFMNDIFEQLTGLNHKEAFGRSFFELVNFPAESKKILLKKLLKRIQGKFAKPYDISLTDATGKKIFVEVNGKKVKYKGKIADPIVFHEITQRKEDTRQLKKNVDEMEKIVSEKVKEIKDSEAKRQIISSITSDFVFSCLRTPQGAFAIDWMAGPTKEVFGYSDSEIKDRGCWKFTVHHQDLPIFEEKITGLQPGKSAVSELRITRKDGSIARAINAPDILRKELEKRIKKGKPREPVCFGSISDPLPTD